MVGIIGIASNIVDKTMPPSHGEGLRFTIGQEELPVFIEKLRRERVDIVIVISHLGFPQDVKLCSGTEGIDIWLSGHTHNRLFQPVYINGTAIVQSGCHGSFLSRLDLDINNKKIKDLRHQILPVVEGIIPHPEVDEIIKTSLEPYRVHLKKIVGRTATDLNRNTILESTMDNLLLDSLIDLTETQVAFSNGWRYGAPIPYGPITMNDLYNIIPMNPFISVIQLTGRELWMMMEENLERTFSRDPYKQMGGYVKRCHGLNVYFKVENPPGTRIQEFFICGKRLRPNEIYSATFVTFQAVPQEYGTGREQLDVRAIDALHQYIVKNHVVKSEFRGTVVAV